MQKNRAIGKANVRDMARAGILCALIVVMTVVPYTGYINYGLVEITTLHIVVALGAVMLGARYGGVLGAVWGITCMLRALTNPLWAPFVNPLVSVLPRCAVGIVAGLTAEQLRKLKCKPYVVASVSAAVATLTNTVLVLTMLKLTSAEFAGIPLFGTIYTTLVGVNGVIELAAAIIITPSVIAAIQPRALALGIDLGASTTKLALVKGNRCVRTMRVADGQTLEAALEEFGLSGVRKIAVTGVGAFQVQGSLHGLPTEQVDEFLALSRGASRCAKSNNCVVTSVGTGTSFTRVTPLRCWHIGGTGMGGALLKGLSERLCGISDMEEFQALAAKGTLHNIDLQLQDVCMGTLSNLQPESTVANMAKTKGASEADIAAGLCNLIFQSIGVMAAFAVKKRTTRTIVLVGTITDWPIAARSLDPVAALHNVRFVVPDNAAFVTAIGAAMD